MIHEEIVGRFKEYRDGLLPKKERTEIQNHLLDCIHCRVLFARLKSKNPSEVLYESTMARLWSIDGSPMTFPGVRWLTVTGSIAALLVISAFWHPEKSWLQVDHYFGLFHGGFKTSSVSKVGPKGG